jgi:hypothetical protein
MDDQQLIAALEELKRKRDSAVRAGREAAAQRSRVYNRRREDLKVKTQSVNARRKGSDDEGGDCFDDDLGDDEPLGGYDEPQENHDLVSMSEEEDDSVLNGAGLKSSLGKKGRQGKGKGNSRGARGGKGELALKKRARGGSNNNTVKQRKKKKVEVGGGGDASSGGSSSSSGDSGSSDSDDPSEDEDESEMTPVSFWMNKGEGYFSVRWKENGRTSTRNERGELVLMDARERCMDILWNRHRRNGSMRAWLDRVGPRECLGKGLWT